MYAFIEGKLHSKQANETIINCSGVGYYLLNSIQTYDSLPEIGENVLLHTHLIVREDAQLLYGFYTIDELELFKLLISINGIGPKIALGILSSITAPELHSAINKNDLNKLTKLPGVGKKTAEVLLVHLRDKIKKLAITDTDLTATHKNESKSKLFDEAISALISLGYTKSIAEKAVHQSLDEFNSLQNQNIESLIRLALKFAMK